MNGLQHRFDAAMRALSPGLHAVGLGVSGGGDSMALLHLASDWAAREGVRLAVATVDHGLRPEAAAEAELVARAAASLGLTHHVLHWSWEGSGNLQDSARKGRQQALADWATAQGVSHVALGHTRDDQAETLLMRLQRGSGVDGLAGMAGSRRAQGVVWLRPLLDMRRAELRAELTARAVRWVEDPSNDDTSFDRVRIRHAIDALGLDIDRLADTAGRMRAAQQVLDHAAQQAAGALVQQDRGDLLIDRAGLQDLPRDTRERLVAAALCWVGSTAYRPRLASLRSVIAREGGTLHGCHVSHGDRTLRICREWKAVETLRSPAPGTWDTRWQVSGPHLEGAEIRPLGPRGLLQTDRESWALPRRSLLASPAVWQGDTLIAAPLAGLNGGYRANCRALPPDWPSRA